MMVHIRVNQLYMKTSFIISVVSATVLFQIGHLAAKDGDELPLRVILPGDRNTCPAANILETARASIRSEVDSQIGNPTGLFNRPSLLDSECLKLD